MRVKLVLAQFALLAVLTGCTAGSPDSQNAAVDAASRSDGMLAPARIAPMPPVWADPEFIKS